MKKIGWFEAMLHDVNSFERRAFNEAATAIADQAWQASATDKSVRKLFALDHQQGDPLVKLRASIDVLVQVLTEAGILDADMLKDRIERRLSEIEEAKKPQQTTPTGDGRPYRGGPAVDAPPPEKVLECSTCLKSVYASRTQHTESGVVCDECYFAPIRP